MLTEWTGSLHQTFRLLPKVSQHLVVFLESDGRTPEEVLARLPYSQARGSGVGKRPDPKRYRDPKQVYQTAGLLYERDQVVRVTELGRATRRFLDVLNEENATVLGSHAAYALAGCQLRNPTGSGRRYDPVMMVFPFAFIWRAMLQLDNKISSDELNCEIFRTRDERDLEVAIERIRRARASSAAKLRPPVIRGRAVNDRIIPWISIAGFGWTLILDKGYDEERTFYRILPDAVPLLERAASLRPFHQEFEHPWEYVEYISELAGLPPSVGGDAPGTKTIGAG